MDRRNFIKNGVLVSGGAFLISGTYCFGASSIHPQMGKEPLKINPSLLNNKWDAEWIACPEVSLLDYGVFHFRKTISISKKTKEFIVHVSGDNRYRLFVNGTEVCNGPARSDLLHWCFDSIDIAEWLIPGKNVLAAVVWNFGEYIPLAQITNKTAFIIQGNTENEKEVNSGSGWKVYKNESYISPSIAPAYTTVGPGDEIDGVKYPYGWKQTDFDDNSWKIPRSLGRGVPLGKFTAWDWMLVPRIIPFMEHKPERIREVERTVNITVDKDFLEGKSPINIPAGKKVSILLDQTYLTTAYPELIISGGKGSTIRIGYAEALIDDKGEKGNRNETEGKHLESAYWDIFKPDGGMDRHFQPLWFRTYRYIELSVETSVYPLVIHDLYGYFTAYPFEERAYFKSNDAALKQIWDTGWRTARLCAGETYYDCPYYEQLQYIGDTRIQALISLYVSGDDRLMRNAIDQFYNSLLPVGLTQARFPSSQPQVIPPFSLFWIGMIHDFWMHRDDQEFVKKYLHGINSVLSWFNQQLVENGMLGPMEWWNFVDWSFGPWDGEKPLGGVPEGGMDGNSSILTLLYAYSLQMAADLFESNEDTLQSKQQRQLAKSLIASTYSLCWSNEKSLLADSPKKKIFSQHANILAVLTGMFDGKKETALMAKVLEDPELIKTTLYFKFYLVQAMNKAGLADNYLKELKPWKEMIDIGLTTFAETPEPTRSDCHAWSASPNYDLLATVCGIRPATPGFKSVKIGPHPGSLNYIEGGMPHPKGAISVNLKRQGKEGIRGEIILPEGLSGKFVWDGKETDLTSGKQYVEYK